MKELYTFLFEAVFQNKEWEHRGAYDYPVALIDDIIKNRKVVLGAKGDRTIDLDLSADDIEQLQNIKANVRKDNALSDFDALAKKLGFSFRDVYKGSYSGHTGRGMEGQIFESLVCYLFNHQDGDIQKWYDKFGVDKNAMWEDNTVRSAEIIRKFMDKNYGNANSYVALHVDGQNFDTYGDTLLKLAGIFKGKSGLASVIGKKNADDMYDVDSKDKWNPADIVLFRKDPKAWEQTLADIVAGNSGAIANDILVAKLGDGLIIPISLKAIDENGKIYGHNIDTAEFMDSHEIVLTKLQLGKKYDKGTTGNFIVIGITEDGVPADIQVRAQVGNDNLSIEAKLQSGKARGGKGITVVKKALGIKNNSYYASFEDNDELFEEFAKYGFVDENGKDITKCPDSLKNIDLYNRTCYRGFFGLLRLFEQEVKSNPKLKSSYGKDDNLLLNFTKFLWNACTECPGSYYILK